MENRRKKSSSSDTFSFPSTPVHEQDSDEDFEFGCFTPDSASSDPCKDSPADHLFFNGKTPTSCLPISAKTTAFRSSDRYKTGGGGQAYGSSQRWQFITPVPALSRDTSVKKKVEIAAAGKGKPNKAKKKEGEDDCGQAPEALPEVFSGGYFGLHKVSRTGAIKQK
ncbi:hypothetical protein M0R45_014804 [Rubus argutus]|uniref:Uncharacterized protein n=1 Tax=Rubus argutus TaxID=59490 RepID=A0AAW1XNW0_RUBAR